MSSDKATIDFAWRRQTVFLVLSGFFLGTLAFLNVVGISRFLDLSFDVFGVSVPLAIAVGVLPYPITFLCTDLISELFGEKKAREMVWIGLLLNLWVLLILWLGSGGGRGFLHRGGQWFRGRLADRYKRGNIFSDVY